VDSTANLKNLSGIVVEEMKEQDWNAGRGIYLEGIRAGSATFETQAPKWGKWDAGHLRSCRLVAREGMRFLVGRR
jgi:L-amino acid N-acyltransferase YncA